jgi:hypothetical protein
MNRVCLLFRRLFVRDNKDTNSFKSSSFRTKVYFFLHQHFKVKTGIYSRILSVSGIGLVNESA